MIGVVVLAAGESARMGRLKQLIDYRGRSLVRRAAEVALEAGCGPVVVVLGAQAERVREALNSLDLDMVVNRDWRDGMSRSIRTGIDALQQKHPGADAALLMTCDQPLIRAEVLHSLIEARGTGSPMAACEYGGTLGVPSLFDATLFPELKRLSGDAGARRVLLQHAERVARVPWPDGEVDLDTPADYQALLDEQPGGGR